MAAKDSVTRLSINAAKDDDVSSLTNFPSENINLPDSDDEAVTDMSKLTQTDQSMTEETLCADDEMGQSQSQDSNTSSTPSSGQVEQSDFKPVVQQQVFLKVLVETESEEDIAEQDQDQDPGKTVLGADCGRRNLDVNQDVDSLEISRRSTVDDEEIAEFTSSAPNANSTMVEDITEVIKSTHENDENDEKHVSAAAELDKTDAAKAPPAHMAKSDAVKPAPAAASKSDAVKPAPAEASKSDAVKPAPAEASTSDAVKTAPAEASTSDAVKPAPAEASTSDAVKPAPAEASKSDSVKPPPAEVSKSDAVKPPSAESPQSDAVKPAAAEAESPLSDSGNPPPGESPQSDVVKPPDAESANSDDVKGAGAESPNSDVVNTPEAESANSDVLNTPAAESPNSDAGKSQAAKKGDPTLDDSNKNDSEPEKDKVESHDANATQKMSPQNPNEENGPQNSNADQGEKSETDSRKVHTPSPPATSHSALKENNTLADKNVSKVAGNGAGPVVDHQLDGQGDKSGDADAESKSARTPAVNRGNSSAEEQLHGDNASSTPQMSPVNLSSSNSRYMPPHSFTGISQHIPPHGPYSGAPGYHATHFPPQQHYGVQGATEYDYAQPNYYGYYPSGPMQVGPRFMTPPPPIQRFQQGGRIPPHGGVSGGSPSGTCDTRAPPPASLSSFPAAGIMRHGLTSGMSSTGRSSAAILPVIATPAPGVGPSEGGRFLFPVPAELQVPDHRNRSGAVSPGSSSATSASSVVQNIAQQGGNVSAQQLRDLMDSLSTILQQQGQQGITHTPATATDCHVERTSEDKSAKAWINTPEPPQPEAAKVVKTNIAGADHETGNTEQMNSAEKSPVAPLEQTAAEALCSLSQRKEHRKITLDKVVTSHKDNFIPAVTKPKDTKADVIPIPTKVRISDNATNKTIGFLTLEDGHPTCRPAVLVDYCSNEMWKMRVDTTAGVTGLMEKFAHCLANVSHEFSSQFGPTEAKESESQTDGDMPMDILRYGMSAILRVASRFVIEERCQQDVMDDYLEGRVLPLPILHDQIDPVIVKEEMDLRPRASVVLQADHLPNKDSRKRHFRSVGDADDDDAGQSSTRRSSRLQLLHQMKQESDDGIKGKPVNTSMATKKPKDKERPAEDPQSELSTDTEAVEHHLMDKANEFSKFTAQKSALAALNIKLRAKRVEMFEFTDPKGNTCPAVESLWASLAYMYAVATDHATYFGGELRDDLVKWLYEEHANNNLDLNEYITKRASKKYTNTLGLIGSLSQRLDHPDPIAIVLVSKFLSIHIDVYGPSSDYFVDVGKKRGSHTQIQIAYKGGKIYRPVRPISTHDLTKTVPPITPKEENGNRIPTRKSKRGRGHDDKEAQPQTKQMKADETTQGASPDTTKQYPRQVQQQVGKVVPKTVTQGTPKRKEPQSGIQSGINVKKPVKDIGMTAVTVHANPQPKGSAVSGKSDDGRKQAEHGQPIRIACETCGKVITKKHMPDHMKKHTGVCDFKCEYCGKEFIFRAQYNTHFNTHQCPILNKKFPDG